MDLLPKIAVGSMVGLLHRRRKWHVAEYNRIAASMGGLPKKTAHEAMLQHRIALKELEALIAAEEPPWGPERDITEQYAHFHPEAVEESLLQEPEQSPAGPGEE